MAKQVLKGGAADFQRLGRIGVLEQMSWAKIPTYYYDFRRFDLPLTAAEVSAEFGANIGIFDNQGVDPGCARQTNAAVGSGVNEAFVALGAGVIAMGEGEGFALHGASFIRPAAEQATPAALIHPGGGGAECYCGAVRLDGQAATTRLATLWWGTPTWRFIEKFFQAYRLQVVIGSRFQIVDESLFDVGMAPVPPEFVGASNSRIPTMPFIRAVNSVMAAKAINQMFVPANIAMVTNAQDVAESLCLPPPLAEVTYGHPRIAGLANRIYCFNSPILFIPGMRFEVDFVNVEDVSCYTALQNSIQANCTTADALLTDNVNAADRCGVSCTIPGGSVSLGVVFKGFALWPQATVEYLASYLVPGSMHAAMYQESSQYLGGLLANPDIDQKLRGRVAGNLGMPANKSE